MLAGQGLLLLPLRLQGAQPGFWFLVGPPLLAGLGNGLVIAPNQDFALGSVPREEAGTAGGALISAQRLGAAIGIAVIGTALFGSGTVAGGAGSSGAAIPSLVHSAQPATAVNLCFVAAALLCAFGLPRRLPGEPDAAGQSVHRDRDKTQGSRPRAALTPQIRRGPACGRPDEPGIRLALARGAGRRARGRRSR